MKISELRNKKEQELYDLLAKKQKDLQDYRFQASVRKLKNPHLIKDTKKTIARILTILIERNENNE